MEDKTQKYRRRWAALESERNSFIDHWKQINSFILPRRGRFLSGDVNKGLKINQKIIDSEATFAVTTLVAGLMSGVTSPSRRWFRLVAKRDDLRENGEVKRWLKTAEDILYEVFAESNFYTVLPMVYEDLVVYGTAAMIQLDDFEDVARFQCFPIGEYCLAQDEKYQVNSIYRKFKMTVEQIVRAYGLENCSKQVKTYWKEGSYDKWIEVIHLIEPNDLRDLNSKLAKDKAYRSVVFEVGGDGNLLHEGGFDNFRVYAPRWHLQSGDIYGRSPGMDALGDVKQLMTQQKQKGEAVAKMVKPPMVASSGMEDKRMTLIPGDVTFTDGQKANDGFAPAYQVQPRLNEFLVDMNEVKSRIRRAFFADLFLMMHESDRRQITAEEIIERRSEKFLTLGPVMNRLDKDLLGEVIPNTFNQVVEAGLLPPPPAGLTQIEMNIEYVSVMADAQRSQGLEAITDYAAFIGNLMQFNPAVGDKFNWDQAADEYANMRGTPPSVVMSDDDVEGKRAADAEQQAAQANLEMASQGAQAAKTLSETDLQGQNLLNDMLTGAVQ